MGVIDTISKSFRIVARKPWLAIIPVILDLFLWLGPRLSVQTLAEKAAHILEEWAMTFSQSGNPEATTAPLESAIELLQSADIMQLNLFELLAWAGLVGMPSVAGSVPEMARPNSIAVSIVQMSEFWQLFPAQLLLLAMGLFLAAVFLTLLGFEVRGESIRWSKMLTWTVNTWIRLLASLIPIGLMFLTAAFIGTLLSPLVIFIAIGLLWFLIYIAFFPQAIALAGHKPLAAIISSFHVVRVNFWASISILVLTALLSNGLGLIWQHLVQSSATGALVAIMASSYVGTALTTALFIFYRDRLILLHELIRKQRSV